MRGPRGAGDRRDPAPAAPLTPAHLLGRLGAAPPPRPAAGQVPQRQDAHLHLQSEKALLTQPLRGAAPAPGQRSRHQREARGARQLGASLPGSGEGAAGGGRAGLCRSRQAPSRHRFTIRPIRGSPPGSPGRAAGQSARGQAGARQRGAGRQLPPARGRFAPFLGAVARRPCPSPFPSPPLPPLGRQREASRWPAGKGRPSRWGGRGWGSPSGVPLPGRCGGASVAEG